MHMIYYKHCICCDKRFEMLELRQKATMKCPNSNQWRNVIDSKMPTAKTPEEASKISDALNNFGFKSNGSHLNRRETTKEIEYVIRITLVEDILEELMKHVPYEGALYHSDEIVCEECVIKMRKKLYNGEAETPEIRCPICDTVLVLLEE